MIQRTGDITNETELFWMVGALKDTQFYGEAKTVFVQLFFSRFTGAEAGKLVDFVRREVPQAKVVAMSLFGDPFVGLNAGRFIRFNYCLLNSSDVTLFTYDNKTQRYGEIVTSFRAALSSIPDAAGVMILGSGLTLPISRFMEEVTAGFEEIPFFGSVANINTADVGQGEPFAFGDRMISDGIVAAVFSGKDLHFYTEQLFAWKPIGKTFRVESEEIHDDDGGRSGRGGGFKIGDTLIKKIDGVPATQIYKKYFNVEPNCHFISNICEFPLAVERNGSLIARVPCGFNERGELNMMGDVKDGESVRFTYGKVDDILRESHAARLRMAEFAPEAVFLYVCANRSIFMKDRAHEEIDEYERLNIGTMYCHGFAELYRWRGSGGVFNSTLVTVGLREGEQRLARWRENWSALTSGGGEFAGLFTRSEGREEPETVGEDAYAGFMDPNGNSIPLSERLVAFLEATTDDLKRATEAANAASEAKTSFLSSMSHEIRTPINAILGLDEMILRESGEESVKGYARDIQSSGRALLSIVNDILDFSKIEAGKMEIIPADYDLRRMIRNLAMMVAVRARNKGLEFVVDVDETIPHLLFGDAARIQQCVLNILTNAVKYTRRGRVMLSVGAEPSGDDEVELCISVRDSGIGIREDDLRRLFRPFERIEERRNRSIEGTGLGISIVNSLLSQMGSSLIVHSVYGEGSAFSFAVRQKVRSWERIGTREESHSALAKEAEDYAETFQAPDAHILVVDDTPINLTVVRGLLKQTRISVDTAASAEEGLSLARKRRYDILFIDHLMPKMDGVEMLAALRADGSSASRDSPCVALTANAVSGAREMYLAAGFCRYISKPVDPSLLEETISRLLPKEFVRRRGDKGFVEETAEIQPGRAADALFSDVFALNAEEALKNCGSVGTFRDAVRNFREAIPRKADEIGRCAECGDWNGYTILVHALKSSARLIGAGGLSDLARELESAGNGLRANPGDAAAVFVQEKTPVLLSLYRSYEARLAPLCGEFALAGADSEKRPISREEMEDALSALGEVAAAFDFASADAIVAELDCRAVPPEFAEKYAAVRSAVRDVDAIRIAEILSESAG